MSMSNLLNRIEQLHATEMAIAKLSLLKAQVQLERERSQHKEELTAYELTVSNLRESLNKKALLAYNDKKELRNDIDEALMAAIDTPHILRWRDWPGTLRLANVIVDRITR